MKIENEIIDKAGRFYIKENNETVAEMDFQYPDENTLLIVHTEVGESLEGKGVGKHLVKAAVDYAREHSLQLTATCTFAKKVLDRSPEYADVYHAEKNKS
jgi:predicted GNAT family acetyltransferase